MGCCQRKKLTRTQKAAKRFGEYKSCLVGGVLASIVVLGLSASVIAKVPHNAAMIWHLCLSILTAAIMIVLLVRVDKFDLVDGCPRVTKVRRTYTAILLVTALWATAMASLFLDWPSDSTGLPYNKRYMVDQPISSSIDGPVWGCVAADLSFTIGAFLPVFNLARAMRHAKKARDESVSVNV